MLGRGFSTPTTTLLQVPPIQKAWRLQLLSVAVRLNLLEPLGEALQLRVIPLPALTLTPNGVAPQNAEGNAGIRIIHHRTIERDHGVLRPLRQPIKTRLRRQRSSVRFAVCHYRKKPGEDTKKHNMCHKR